MMAIVPDLSGNYPQSLVVQSTDRDPALSMHNRLVAGSPNTVLTPLFVGEIVYDTTNNEYYRATTAANNTWALATLEIA